jgi:hypothetical protein
LFVAIACAILFRIYREYVPSGARPVAFLFGGKQGGEIKLPEGTIIYVYFHDAGVFHRYKNHWVWLVVRERITGLRVVAEGYVSEEDYYRQRIVMEFVDGSVRVRFLKNRRSDDGDFYYSRIHFNSTLSDRD